MHNQIKFESCKLERGAVAGGPARLSFHIVGCCTHPKITFVLPKTRFVPSIQNTRKSLSCFDWNNCTLLTCTSSRKLSTSIFSSLFPPIQPKEQQHRVRWETRSKHTSEHQAQGPPETAGPDITFHLFLVHRNISIQLEPSKLETNLKTSSAFHFSKVLLKRNWFPKVILTHPPLHYQPRDKSSSHLGPVEVT